jgi:hypothetical protein
MRPLLLKYTQFLFIYICFNSIDDSLLLTFPAVKTQVTTKYQRNIKEKYAWSVKKINRLKNKQLKS